MTRLTEIVPPPARPSSGPPNWAAVEARLGCRLPHDYKQLVDVYGPGKFDEFLHIYQPDSPYAEVDLGKQAEVSVQALRTLRAMGSSIPYALDGTPELLSFGRDDNGDIGFWHRRDVTDPASWTVTVKDARADEWFTFAGGLTDFLFALFSRQITVPLFPDDFPSDEPLFEPY
ncbi:SMI1/KNR4 family protein [Streptomyces sp. URMC 129]|uniref:SMI1/KNR4 family protein n=1 Tax=Streptomyces sp. URMC 129 TaxID=3423407 RepID=UPI003F1A73A7